MRFSISIAKSMHLLYWPNPLKFQIKPLKFQSSPSKKRCRRINAFIILIKPFEISNKTFRKNWSSPSKNRYRKINAFFHFYRKINAFDILNKPLWIFTKCFYRKINAFFHFYRQSNAFVILTKPFEIPNKTFKFFTKPFWEQILAF